MIIDPRNNVDDFETWWLSELGFSIKMISEHTGYSKSQVSNRRRKFNVRASDFRNGVSPLARSLIKQKFGKDTIKKKV